MPLLKIVLKNETKVVFLLLVTHLFSLLGQPRVCGYKTRFILRDWTASLLLDKICF